MVKRIRGNCIDCGIRTTGNKASRCRKCAGIERRIHNNIKEYRRNLQLNKKYGMNFGEFEVWWFACQGKCFICKKKMEYPNEGQGQNLHAVAVDHDHKTGIMRGLLCGACNKGLGFFNDDINLLKSAIKYLGE